MQVKVKDSTELEEPFSDHDKKELEGLESETNQASLYWKV